MGRELPAKRCLVGPPRLISYCGSAISGGDPPVCGPERVRFIKRYNSVPLTADMSTHTPVSKSFGELLYRQQSKY